MTRWSLEQVLSGLHDEIQGRLQQARQSIGHSSTKGDATERVWLSVFKDYLPARYRAKKAHVVDSKGQISDQIDVVIFDRQYSPFIFNFAQQLFVPAESVYGVLESKQTVDAGNIRYSQGKIASVRRLHRTSLPIPHAGGTFAPKEPFTILGGFLSLESEWNPPLGTPLRNALASGDDAARLDIGCVAAHGHFHFEVGAGDYVIEDGGRPATAFLFNLISQLQSRATVPMIDIQAYGRWLSR